MSLGSCAKKGFMIFGSFHLLHSRCAEHDYLKVKHVKTFSIFIISICYIMSGYPSVTHAWEREESVQAIYKEQKMDELAV